MKETSFIKQNKEKWHKFEQMYHQNKKDPDELSSLFVELTDDLSYARTHYPKRTVRVYLNGLAQKVYNQLYRKKRDSFSKVIQFWKISLPLEIYRARKALITSLVVTLIGFIIGWSSTIDNPFFLDVVAGEGRVAYEEECIAFNKPISVYQTQDETTMFFSLVINNLRVSFLAFVMGMLISIGTGFFMVYNGILLGSFLAFYKFKGYFAVCMLTIWLHGTFEISAIIIAGAAGITLGNSMLFPGSMTRAQSLLLGAKRGMKIMIGLSPFMIMAGFIEAFISRYGPDMHWMANLTIIGLCAVLILYYFVIYPIIVARRENFNSRLEEKPIFIQEKTIQWHRLRSFQDIFNDAFVFYRKGLALFGKAFIFIFLISIVTVYFAFIQSGFKDFELGWTDKVRIAFSFNDNFNPFVFCAHGFLIASNFLAVLHALVTFRQKEHSVEGFSYFKSFLKFYFSHVLKMLPVSFLLLFLIAFLPWWLLLLSVFITPLIFHLSLPGIIEKKSYFKGVQRGLKIAWSSWMKGVGIFTVFLVPAILCAFCPTLIVEIFKTEVLGWFIETQAESPEAVYNIVDGCYYAMIIHLILPLFTLAFVFLYYSTIEREEAHGLFERLNSFGKNSRLYETPGEGDY